MIQFLLRGFYVLGCLVNAQLHVMLQVKNRSARKCNEAELRTQLCLMCFRKGKVMQQWPANTNPQVLKNQTTLLVYWMHKKVWVTKALMPNWFMQSSIRQVKQYLNNLCMEFQVLLVLHNAREHPADLNCDGVKIEFLPPNTTSLHQPMTRASSVPSRHSAPVTLSTILLGRWILMVTPTRKITRRNSRSPPV